MANRSSFEAQGPMRFDLVRTLKLTLMLENIDYIDFQWMDKIIREYKKNSFICVE